MSRFPTHVEVAGILRRIDASGDYATVMRRGDAERGSLLLLVTSRGLHIACLERRPNLEGVLQWIVTGPGESASSAEIADFLGKRARFDPDSWVVELDIADPERFIAETTSSG
ncbi:MAG TPA: DUF1491 family protein [Sphingomicrobium sp.]|nr:DUF1491 family protein [Sphingomicrobium sp.]